MNTVFSVLYARVIWPLRDRLRPENGLEAVEYALIAALISAVIVTVMAAFRTQLEGIFTAIGNALNGAAAEINGGDGTGG